MKQKILNMLGLAQKAGRIASGETAAECAVKSGNTRLLIVAADASDGSRKHWTDKTAYRQIPCVTWGTKEELGRAVGKAERSALAVTDENFALRIREMLREENAREELQGE